MCDAVHLIQSRASFWADEPRVLTLDYVSALSRIPRRWGVGVSLLVFDVEREIGCVRSKPRIRGRGSD